MGALVLAPTRELAGQIHGVLTQLLSFFPKRTETKTQDGEGNRGGTTKSGGQRNHGKDCGGVGGAVIL